MDFRITITGTMGLLMHNGRLVNPLDPMTKELSRLNKKQKKTEEDYQAIARAEFLASLYTDGDIGPYIPSDNIWRCLYDGAKKSKRGPRVKEGVLITTMVNPLQYSGPREASSLWDDENFRHFAPARVSTSRVMRCRPFFSSWSVEADGIIDTGVLELDDLKQIADTAGQLIGLGDWRPKYGRFTADTQPL